jgi:hypothetical protein
MRVSPYPTSSAQLRIRPVKKAKQLLLITNTAIGGITHPEKDDYIT